MSPDRRWLESQQWTLVEEDGVYTLNLITPTFGGGGTVVRLTVVDEPSDGLLIGNAAIARMGADCCGKPKGCTNPTEECLYKGHPSKRHLYRL